MNKFHRVATPLVRNLLNLVTVWATAGAVAGKLGAPTEDASGRLGPRGDHVQSGESMHKRVKLSSSLVAMAFALVSGGASGAVITNVTVGVGPGNLGPNLLLNPSFEIGAAGANLRWAGDAGMASGGTPNGDGPSTPIPSWTSGYGPGAYGWWGPLGFAGAPCADGVACVYFGNAFTTPSLAPTFNADGTVTFAGSPTFTNGNPNNQTPVSLSQTVALNAGDTYTLDFWVSGEANTGGFNHAGVFKLDIGNASVFLTDIAAVNPGGIEGAATRFFVTFTADASDAITFTNFGHACAQLHGARPRRCPSGCAGARAGDTGSGRAGLARPGCRPPPASLGRHTGARVHFARAGLLRRASARARVRPPHLPAAAPCGGPT